MKTTVSDEPQARHEATTSTGAPRVVESESDAVESAITQTLPERAPPRILGLLGSGGMATVHLATDEPLGREVALKRLHQDVRANARKQAEFVHEARILGQLQHPGILPVFQLARDEEGLAYFTMQVIEGRSLRQYLAAPSRALGTQERISQGIDVLLKVADAVAYAHSRGVLHRDIKPDNVMIGLHGRVYLVDWGVALGPEERRTGATPPRFAGTPGYMAPEQARAESVDERCDIFGLGAMLFEILTDQIPFSEESGDLMREETLGRVLKAESVAPKNVPSGLCQVCDRALATNPDERYATVEDFQADLRSVLSGGILLPRRTFSAGDTIIQEGDLGDTAYLILDGTCLVTQGSGDAQRTVRTMGVGEIFGELALLLEGPRTATVTAQSRTTLLVVDKRALEQSGALHGFPAALLRALAKRFFDLESEKLGK